MAFRAAAAGGGGKRPHDTGLADMPIAPDMLPKPNYTYSQWVHNINNKRLTGENAADTTPAYNEDTQIFWGEYVDWAKEHPMVLEKTMTMYMNDANAWIFELFPLNITMSDRVMSSSIEIELTIPDIGTRKVPGRNIWSKVSRREEHTRYIIQGFVADYTYMKTLDGQKEWDMKVAAVASNIWSAIILDALHEFSMQPNLYFSPNHNWSFEGLPTTPEQVFQRKAASFGIYNRNPQAHADINAKVSRVFEQRRLTLTRWIMTRGDLYRLGLQDETNRYADKSGVAVALRTRRDGAMIQSILGNRIYVIPLLDGTQYNDHDEWVLQSEVQTGSKAEFPAYGPDDDASKFRSRQRDIEFCSWTSNTWDTYRFVDFLDHCIEFVPSRGALPGYEPGTVNRDLLIQMAANRADVFRRTACADTVDNRRRLNALLAYFPREQVNYPIEVFGEIDDAFNHTDEYPWAAETLQHALFKDFTEEDMKNFHDGLAFVKDLKYQPPRNNPYRIERAAVYGTDFVRATSDLVARETEGMDDPGYLGCYMLAPNEWGFVNIDPNINLARTRMNGMGHISAMLYLENQFRRGTNYTLAEPTQTLIKTFVKLYERVVKNLKSCCPDHPAIDPRLVPLYHNSTKMNDFTRSMIVAWYTLFDAFTPPVVRDLGMANDSNETVKDTDPSTDPTDPSKGKVFATYPASLVGKFAAYFENADTPGLFTEQVAEQLKVNIATIKDAQKTLEKFTSDASDKKKNKLLDGVAALVAPLNLVGTGAGNQDEIRNSARGLIDWLNTDQNATMLGEFFGYLCRNDDIREGAGGADFNLADAWSRAQTKKDEDPAGPEPGSKLTIIPLVFASSSLRGNRNYGHPILQQISDNSNSYTNARANVVKMNDNTSPCMSAFDPEDDYSYGGTLGTALAFVNPHYPLLPRAGNIGDALMRQGVSGLAVGRGMRAIRYRDGAPGTIYADQDISQYVYTELERRMFVDARAFDEASAAFPDLNRAMLQSIVAPFCGHPNLNELTFFELRWVKSHDLSLAHGIAMRAYLLAPCRASTFRGFDRCNVEIMFGGDAVRYSEGQIMHHQIALADGSIGRTHMRGLDNTIGFRQLSQEFVIQAFTDHKAMIERYDAYIWAESTRGGIGIGGKGNRYVNENVQVWPKEESFAAAVHDRLGDSSLLGDNSVIACLAGYNHARDPFKDGHWDMRGNWKIEDFVNELHESHEFVKVRQSPMYAGQFIFNFVFEQNINYEPPRKDIDKMSFADKKVLRRMNYHVHQTTQRCHGGTREIKSKHLWGDQYPGLALIEQGLTTTKLPMA